MQIDYILHKQLLPIQEYHQPSILAVTANFDIPLLFA